MALNHQSFNLRSQFAIRAAAIHLFISLTIATALAILVFGVWFPFPLRELVEGTRLFLLVAAVDVVCGPVLTAVVFNPLKPRAELRRDLCLIALIQILAFGYGLHTLAHARPIAIVFEVDRLRALTFNDLDESETALVPDWGRPWRFTPPRFVGLRSASTPAEKVSSIEASLNGIEPSQRPSWWQDYALSIPAVLGRAKPLTELRAKHPDQTERLSAAVASAIADIKTGETANPGALLWLPLVSRRVTDWVVLLDPVTARIRGYAHLDGF